MTDGEFATEFYAGWLTEYSLSVDNLFVFVIIMARFQVPRKLQQEALMVGIIIALVLRGIFILLGAAVIERFVWVFYIFGASSSTRRSTWSGTAARTRTTRRTRSSAGCARSCR